MSVLPAATGSPADIRGVRRRSRLVVGAVHHRRRRPALHSFTMRTYHALLDVDELGELDRGVWGFGVNRRAVFGFRDRDHFGSSPLPVREKLAAWLEGTGTQLPEGRVLVLTGVRVLGYVFDPVSWWFCHHADGRLAFVVAEVHNTFGESHAYLLDQLESGADGRLRAHAPKRFHVSPFLPLDGLMYDFGFCLDERRVTVRVDVSDENGPLFGAAQSGVFTPFTTCGLWSVNARHPLMSWRVIGRIHIEALRLLRRGVPFHRKPPPPPDELNGRGAVPGRSRTMESPR